MAYIVGTDRNQINMVLTSLDEMIDTKNSVRVVDAYVNSLDLPALGFKEYSGNRRGQSPYLRSDLLKLHIYGYLNKIRSSRKLEVESKRNLELMWLINSIQPDHGTIARFVSENKSAFRKALRELTLVLKGWRLIDGKVIAIDGTKIRAQNSKRNCISVSSLNKKIEYAEEQINSYLAKIENSDDVDCYKEKLKAYQELKESYQSQQEELKENGMEQKSITDSDSRRMKNNGSLEICYNVQTVVDSKNHLVIDAVSVNDINDQNQLSKMALNAKKLLRKRKMMVLADTGYYNGAEIKKCIDEKLTVLIKKAKANNKTKAIEYRKEKFLYDTDKDIYICPESQELPFFENSTKNSLKYRRFKCFNCNDCLKKSQCTTSKTGRTIQRWEYEDILDEVRNTTLTNNEVYKLRRSIVEHPYGTLKRTLGYSYFLRKGLENVNAESSSMFIAYNLKRLLGMHSVQDLCKMFIKQVV